MEKNPKIRRGTEGDEENSEEAIDSKDDKHKEGESEGAVRNSKHAKVEGMEREEMSSLEAGESKERQEMEP